MADPLLLGIIGLFIAFIFTVVLLFVYSGLFSVIDVNTGKPPIANMCVAYKFAKGSYSDCGPFFTEVCAFAPDLRSIGVFYDDPKKVEPSNQRFIIGAILSEADSQMDKEIETKLLERGYKLAHFPAVDHAVITSFPHTWALSVVIATARVWPLLGQYVKEKKLCAHPAIEIYSGDEIQYMLPLSKQEEFYVEEAKKAQEEMSAMATEALESDVTMSDESEQQDITPGSYSSGSNSGSDSSFEELNLKDGDVVP